MTRICVFLFNRMAKSKNPKFRHWARHAVLEMTGEDIGEYDELRISIGKKR